MIPHKVIAKSISSITDEVDAGTVGTFEDLFSTLGGFGPAQLRILALICLSDITSSISVLSLVFTGATPKYATGGKMTCMHAVVPRKDLVITVDIESERSE